jgi:hypothetical protein
MAMMKAEWENVRLLFLTFNSKEFALEKAMAKMKADWENVRFIFLTFNSKEFGVRLGEGHGHDEGRMGECQVTIFNI